MISQNLNEVYKYLGVENNEALQKKRARLFPNGKRKVEDEQTTCSIFLACLVGIKEFREELLLSLNSAGANKINNQTAELHAFIEVAPKGVFKDEEGRPDGLLVLTTGKTSKTIVWAAWIEAKTITELKAKQLQSYLDLKKFGVPTVISISNDFTTQPSINPTGIKNKNLFHLSWRYIRSLLKQTKHKGIEDSDQQYMASELIHYLEEHKGVKAYVNMGKEWKENAEHIADTESKKKRQKDAENIASAWIQEEKDIALDLSETELKGIGYLPVELVLNRKERKEDSARRESHIAELTKNHKLTTSYLVTKLSKNETVKNQCRFDLTVNFPNTRLLLEMKVPAAENSKAKGQITQLLKTLTNSGIEDSIKIQANYKNKQQGKTETLKVLREQQKSPVDTYSIIDNNLGKEITSFDIYYSPDLTKSNFYSPTKFISEVEREAGVFYQQVVACFF